jgi:hypothetical protein
MCKPFIKPRSPNLANVEADPMDESLQANSYLRPGLSSGTFVVHHQNPNPICSLTETLSMRCLWEICFKTIRVSLNGGYRSSSRGLEPSRYQGELEKFKHRNPDSTCIMASRKPVLCNKFGRIIRVSLPGCCRSRLGGWRQL